MKMKSIYPVTAAGINRLRRLLLIPGLVLGGVLQKPRGLIRVLALVLPLVLALPGLVAADSVDQDQILKLIKRGELQPLEILLQRHRHRLQGRLIDLELEHHKGRWIYELELLDDQGVVREYLIDAKNGEWLGQE